MPAIDDKDIAIAFGPAKEPKGPSMACRRLAGLLGVPADKVDEFKDLLQAVVEEDDEDDGQPEEEGKPDGMDGEEE